jgi:hypothetical protein
MCLVSEISATIIRQLTFPQDIADYIYKHPTQLDLDLKGIWIADRGFILSPIWRRLILRTISCTWMGCCTNPDPGGQLCGEV